MSFQWFRMYAEFASDPKVQAMAEVMQRRLVMLFCMRCSNTLEELQEDEIAFSLRITKEALIETKKCFIDKKFIDKNWKIRNWDKRQFVSDSSTERVRKYRKKQKTDVTETLQKQDETSSEQNRTDTEQIKDIYDKLWELYPARNGKKIGKDEAAKLFNKLSPEEQDQVLIAVKNYSTSTQYPVDPIRFFKSRDYPKGLWREWVKIKQAQLATSASNNNDLLDQRKAEAEKWKAAR